MSVLEDTPKLLQDFLAPELREFSARVEALEGRMNMRFDAVEKGVDARFDALEKGVDARFDAAERLASERHTQTVQAIGRLADVYELRERITRIEARERAS
jgi:hypothetical protein